MTASDVLRDVWNRACVGAGTGVGDRHLGALLLVDGMVQNGGPNHAADSCAPAELAAAAAGARYFELDALASLIEELPAASSDSDEEDAEDRLSGAYFRLMPDDAVLDAAFQARYAEAPQDFDPV
ncbi:hypothetical protein [Actinoplanes aureus]|uniref:DUF4375 domain-containing protein n=1 Tax=Actinoplanes aureus TaxID=2792083 RepID=A0A931C7S3_9ACTN|nr:hypothetical protein [Actinoplanes aureus]MBG0562267.1 hypothetical protein [Actinoplanes aureus]